MNQSKEEKLKMIDYWLDGGEIEYLFNGTWGSIFDNTHVDVLRCNLRHRKETFQWVLRDSYRAELTHGYFTEEDVKRMYPDMDLYFKVPN